MRHQAIMMSLFCLILCGLRTAQASPQKEKLNQAEKAFQEGNRWAQKRHFDKAIQSYQEALAFHPNYESARLHLGNCLLEQKRFEEAQAQFEELLLINPNHAVAQNNLGTCHAHLGRWDEAIICFTKAHELDPDYDSPQENLEALLLTMMQGGKNIPSPEQKPQQDPVEALQSMVSRNSLHEGYLHAAKVQERTRRAAEVFAQLAIRCLQEGNLEEAEKIAQWLYQCEKGEALAQFVLGATRRLQNRFGEAVLLLERAHQACPEDISPAVELGLSYEARNGKEDRANALACYEHVQRIAPEDPRGYILAGFLYLDEEDWERAEAEFREALDVNQRLVHAWNGLGKIFFIRDDFGGAEQCYRKILDLDPTFDEAKLNLGYTIWHEGNLHEGLALVESVIESDDLEVRMKARDASQSMRAFLMKRARAS